MALIKTEELAKRKRWTTASRLDRGEACPASTVLPELRDEDESTSQIWGQAMHQLIELGFLDKRESGEPWQPWVVKGIEDKLRSCGAGKDLRLDDSFREHWYPAGGHEVSGYLDGTDLEIASLVVGREFPILPTSIRLKMDWVGEKMGEPWVDDLKTGRRPSDPGSLQIAGAAYLIAKITGADSVWGSITHWPRYPKPQLPTRAWHYYDAEELDIVKNRLKNMRDLALTQSPRLNPCRDEWGERMDHCRYCRAECPEFENKNAR